MAFGHSPSCVSPVNMGDLTWATTNDWLEVQNQSFLSWVNHYLEPVGMAVTDFTTDLSDGLRLIMLCEVLSGIKIPRYVKNPKFAAQKMANITEALDFMTKHFGIKFVGCNAQDIMDGKQSQCMGVVFLLINKIKQIGLESDHSAHFAASLSSGNLASPPMTPKSPNHSTAEHEASPPSPKDPNAIISPRRAFDPHAGPQPISRPVIGKKPNNLSVGARDAPSGVTVGANRENTASPKKPRPAVPSRSKTAGSAATIDVATPSVHVVEEVPTDPEKRKEFYITKLQAASRAYLARKKFAVLRTQQNELMSRLKNDVEAQKKVIRLQATVRGMITRNLPSLKARRKRNEIVKEILSTEEKYVKQLTVLVTVYMKALEGLGESVLPQAKMRSIFSEIKVILSYNQLILNMLQARLQKWFENGQMLGDIFLRFTDFLKVYTAYVNNYNESMSTMQDQMINTPQFSETLQQCREHASVGGMEMSSYLIMPIQRIPRYVLLLTDLFKNTPETHKDYQPLKDALTKMENVAQYVNKKKREAENLLGVTTVARHLVGLDSPAEFNQPHRRYVRQGFLQEVDAANVNPKSLKTRYLFLFNDILVSTKEYTGVLSRSKVPSTGFDIDTLRNTDAQFKYLFSFQLLGALIHEIPEQNKVGNMFELVEAATGKKLMLSAPTAQVKDEWIQDLDEQIMSCLEKHRSRIGVPLGEERVELMSDQKLPSLTGTLYKRSESGAWKKRYFILTQDVLTYFPDIVSSVDSHVVPKTVPLVFAGVVTVPLMDRPFCLRLFTKERVYVLSAETAHERLQWVNMIRSSIAKRLTELDLKLKASNSVNMVLTGNNGGSASTIGGSLAESAASTKLSRGKGSETSATTDIPTNPDLNAMIAGVLGGSVSSPASPAPTSERRRKKDKTGSTKKSKTVSGIPAELAAYNAAQASSAATEEDSTPSSPAASSAQGSDEQATPSESGEKRNGKKSSKEKGSRKKKLKRDQTISKLSKTGDIIKFSSGSSKVVKQKMTLKNGELQLFKAGKSKPYSVIDLLLAQSPSNNIESTSVKDATVYQFTLITSDRKYVFGADSEEEATAWVDIIQLARDALSNRS